MDLLSLKQHTDPQGFSAHLRGQGPVFQSPIEKLWVVTDHELAMTVLKSPDFSADRLAFAMSTIGETPIDRVANYFGVVKKMMVNSDAPDHTARRRMANAGIADRIVDHFQPRVRAIVGGLVAKVVSGQAFDFASTMSIPLPNIVLADLFSIPEERRADFYRWANHMTQFFGGAAGDMKVHAANADRGAFEMREYFLELMRARRDAGENDFISHLVRNQGGLADDEVVSQAAIMLVAGTVTASDQICNCLHAILSAGAWERLVKYPELLENAIEEATRLDPSVNFIFRIAKKDLVLGDREIPAGQLVFVSTHAANRDEKVFENPDDFVIGRARNPHLSYGAGVHYCIGARLGRMEMKELFGRMLERFPHLALDPANPARKKHQSLGFSGFETLTLTTERP